MWKAFQQKYKKNVSSFCPHIFLAKEKKFFVFDIDSTKTPNLPTLKKVVN